MQYKEFVDENKISRLGMGNMRLPAVNNDDSVIDYKIAKEMIDYCMRNGINYYDTAYIYHGGKSEEFVGKALASYPRDSFYVADKYNLQANPDYKAQFEEQLKRLQMEYIDFYLLHGIQDSFASEIMGNGCIEYFDKLKDEGRIRYLGFSYHGSPKLLPDILQAYKWDFVQIQLNYYDWIFGDAKELYNMLTEVNIPIIVMEPVHGGLLAKMKESAETSLKALDGDKSIASWAMRWVMNLDNVLVVLSGMSNMEQVKDNISTFGTDKALTTHEIEVIENAAIIEHSEVAVACTACRYCCPDCPVSLDIPFLLKAYNDAKVGGAWRLNRLKALDKSELPGSCIACGSCTKHCPQGFDVPAYMKELQEMME
ncbi:MAG: aldo/keto reductase [Suipraeoptans sp.]